MSARERLRATARDGGSVDVAGAIIDHLDLWTGAVTKKSSSGRGSNGKIQLTGIKKLRELILELAVRGKLVEQNPTDEPASELLERVRAEKLHLVQQGTIKKRRKLPEPSEMTKPFNLPSSWEWAQLEDVRRDWGQKTPNDDFSYIDVASVDSLRGATTQPSILSAEEAPSRARKIVSEGTLIYSTVRPYLQNIAVIERDIEPEPIASTAFAVLHPLGGMPARFYLHYLRSPAFVRYVESIQTGIAYPAINDKQFFSGLVPVPPLEEQHRIVQKVDELMALCDRLEQQTSDQLEAHETLVDTLLGTLTQSESATELADNWARLAAHFDTLFTTEQSIDKLKQTILQLAVMGRLVEQDAGNEPAQSLLNRLAETRQAWLRDQSSSNPECKTMLRKLGKLRPAQSPFPLPRGWQSAHLIQLCSMLVDCHNKTAPYVEAGIPIIRTSNIRERQFNFNEIKYVDEDTYTYWSRRCPPKSGDIIFTREAPMGEAAIIPDNKTWCLGQRTMLIRPMHEHISNSFLLLALTEPHLLDRAAEKAIGSTVKHLRVGDVESLVVPVPPLEEQHRIVQKVDELMALCDQLKERLNQASKTRCQLAEAVVEGALN